MDYVFGKKRFLELDSYSVVCLPSSDGDFSLCAHSIFKSNPHHGLHVADCQKKPRNTETLLQ